MTWDELEKAMVEALTTEKQMDLLLANEHAWPVELRLAIRLKAQEAMGCEVFGDPLKLVMSAGMSLQEAKQSLLKRGVNINCYYKNRRRYED